ncbi:MAG: hypothetical protein AAFX93_19450 [Verrucomicrobiota bacterium]
MNRQQKNYTIDRIQQVVREKRSMCSCKHPSLEEHIKRAVCSGEARLLNRSEINEAAEKAVICGSYRPSLALESIFSEPSSYKLAKAKYEYEEKQIDARNKALEGKAQEIIDKVNLDLYEDGRDAIADAVKLAA